MHTHYLFLTSSQDLMLIQLKVLLLITATVIITTSIQSNLAEGRIAVLSPLATAKVFVRPGPPSNNGSFDPQE